MVAKEFAQKLPLQGRERESKKKPLPVIWVTGRGYQPKLAVPLQFSEPHRLFYSKLIET